VPITRYTLADLRVRVQDRLESVPWYDTALLDDAINESLLLWNLLTGQWRTRLTLLTTPNTYDYALPSTLVFGTRVQYSTFPVGQTSLWELDQGQGGWRTQTTATGGTVPTRPMLWAAVSLTLIHIWPADAVGGGSLLIDGVAATPTLLQAGDYLDLGEESLSPLLDCAAHLATFSEGTDRFAATDPQWMAFLQAAAEQNQQLKRSAQFRRYLGLDKGRFLRMTTGGPLEVPPSLQGAR
jgi:hypothetical protein